MSFTTDSPALSFETIAVSKTPNLLNLNMTNVTKLTSSNYLMWSRQVQALLDGYDLGSYIDGSTTAPPLTITTDDGSAPNPDHALWKRQDRLIFSALLGAITMPLQPIVSTATTAADIWKTLNLTYAKPSRAHFKQLRQHIKHWTKGTKSVNEYFQGLTTKFDELALLGKSMDPEDQIEAILEGLPEDYKLVADQIEGRELPPSLTEIHEKLINHEAKLQIAAPPTSSVPVTANFSHHRGSHINHNNRGNHNRRGGYRGSSPQTWQQQQFHTPQQQGTGRGYQGRCQICSVYGHSARRCPQFQRRGNKLCNMIIGVKRWALSSTPRTVTILGILLLTLNG